uniref:Uncharacterized protein n=1 Tax=viral metagenome TaxID=1070528 RepID=A0A6M3K0W3_9ZZZZ
MEVDQLKGFVVMLILVGMVIGVGVLTLDKFATAGRTSTAVVDEIVAIASGAGNLANDNVTAMTAYFEKSTNASQNYTLTASNWTDTGALSFSAVTVGDGNYNFSYSHNKASASTTTAESVRDSIATIAITWLPLIVTVAALAIIMFMVVGSFAGKR